MMLILILFFLWPSNSWADIFLKAPDQSELKQALSNDIKNSYYRGSYDYNAYAPHDQGYQLEREDISLAFNNYDPHQSLKNLMQTSVEYCSIEQLNFYVSILCSKGFRQRHLKKKIDPIGFVRLNLFLNQLN